MPRTAILLEGWSTTMENWLCLPLDGTIFTCRSTITALEGSKWEWTAVCEQWFRSLSQIKVSTVPRTQEGFSTWLLVTSLRFIQPETTAKFTCRPFTPTLAPIWLKKKDDKCPKHLMNQTGKPDLITNSTCLQRAFHSKSSLVINIDSKTSLSNLIKFTPL